MFELLAVLLVRLFPLYEHTRDGIFQGSPKKFHLCNCDGYLLPLPDFEKKINKFSKSLIVDNDAAEKKSVLWIIERKRIVDLKEENTEVYNFVSRMLYEILSIVVAENGK